MSKPIELSQQERMYLHAMTASQGWVVMLKLMDALCRAATEEAIACDDDEAILKLQRTARATNKFCAELIKQTSWNVESGAAIIRAEEEKRCQTRQQ